MCWLHGTYIFILIFDLLCFRLRGFINLRVQIFLREGIEESSSLFESLDDDLCSGELYPESFSRFGISQMFVHDEVDENFPDLRRSMFTLMGITARLLYLVFRLGMIKYYSSIETFSPLKQEDIAILLKIQPL